MTDLSGPTSQFHATGARRLNLAKRTCPLPLRPYTAPTTPPAPPAPSSSSSSPSYSPPSSPSQVSWRTRSSSPPTPPPPPKTQNPWASKTNWRTGSPPKNTSIPDFDKLVEGQVLYLNLPPNTSIFWQHPAMSEPECHPVVVIKKSTNRAGENCVEIRIITSFGGKRLQDTKPAFHWHFFMQCENSMVMVNQKEVRLAKMAPDSEVFKKRSYINMSLNTLYHVEYKHLSAFRDQPDLRFDRQTVSEIQQTPSYYS